MNGPISPQRRRLWWILWLAFLGNMPAQESVTPAAAFVEGADPSVETTDLYEEKLSAPIEPTKGRFVGKAYDAKSGKPLVGVAIQIEETQDFTITDDKGRFIIDAVDPGTYTVVISQGGYEAVRAEGVVIKSGQISNLASATGALERAPIETSDQVYEMEEIEVVAELVEEGAESLLFDRQQMKELVSMVGKEEFTRTGSSNVGDALKSQTGTNVQDGKYAVIRGLGDRYSNTTLNGAYIPTADPSKKAVQLDLIPTHLVERLLTYKVFSPNLPGEFSGGAIDIQTIRFPEELTIKLSAGVKANSNTTGEEMLVNADRRMNFLGEVSDGLPNIPDPLGLSFRNRPSDPPRESQLEAQRIWRLIHGAGSTRPTTRRAEPGRSWSVTYGNRHETEYGLIGMVLAANHDRDFQIVEDREINRGAKLFDDKFDLTRTQERDTYTSEISWGVLGNLAWRPNEDHE